MESAIKVLNSDLKSDSFDINRIVSYRDELNDKLSHLQKLMSLNNSEVPSKVASVISQVDACTHQIDEASKHIKKLDGDVHKHEKKFKVVNDVTKDYIDKIYLLEKAEAYYRVLQRLDEISTVLEARVNDRGKQPLAEYLELCDWANKFSDTECVNLKTYLKETVCYWHSLIKERLSKDFDDILKMLKWPFIGPSAIPMPSVDSIAKFQSLIEVLIKIQLPTWAEPSSTATASSYPPLSLPIALLLRPLKKRFMYHFSGNKQTNQSDKPEWYFTQILTWIKDHQEFVEKHVQPVYDKLTMYSVHAKMEFARGLVQLALDKLHWDLPHLQYDDVLFSHTVDEALGFARELWDGYGYGEGQPNVANVLTESSNFIKWINLEKKYSLEKLDGMMRSRTAFSRSIPLDDAEFTTECTDRFLTLLSTITDRYSNLPQPGHRLQFLQLQLDLIDDFRVRLLQLLREQEVDPTISSASSVLNSVHSLLHVLEEWAVTPHFLQLNFYKNQLETVSDHTTERDGSEGSVFDEMLTYFEKMQQDLLAKLTDEIAIEVKARSRDYRRERWHAIDSCDGITPSSVPMFQTLTDELRCMCDCLTPSLRRPALLQLAKEFDSFLFEEVVCVVRFSAAGAEQFAYDVRKNLVPLFGQYMSKAEAHFRLLNDSCTLLTLPKGSAMLLKSTLANPNDEDYMTSDVLSNVGVFTLTPPRVLEVLSRRIDMENS